MYLVKFESNIVYGMIIFSKGTNSKVHSHQTQHATKFPPLTSTLGFQIHINRARVMIKVSPMTDSPITRAGLVQGNHGQLTSRRDVNTYSLTTKRKPLTGMTLLQITKRELITRVSLFQNYEKRKLITWMSLTKSRNVNFPHVCHCCRFTKRELLAEMPQNLYV